MRISDWSSDVCSSDPAPGAPDLGRRVADLLAAAGIASDEEHERGWDHGVFVPMKVMAPEAEIPLLQLSLRADLDPAAHIAIGRPLAPLRSEERRVGQGCVRTGRYRWSPYP